jgi:hypothetical protein
MKAKKISKKVVDPIIESLKSIKRFDIDPVNNGEFIETPKRFEEDGEYIKAEDLMLIIEELECVKLSLKDFCKSQKK